MISIMRRIIFSFIVFSVLFSASSPAFERDLELSGYSEPQYLLYDNGVSNGASAWNRFRLDALLRLSEGVTVEADLISLLYVDRETMNFADFLPRRIRRSLPPEIRSQLSSASRDSLYFDNVFLKIRKGRFDVTIGKQQLEFGPGFFRNPVNIFSSRDIIDPTYEKTGHKAIRGDVTIGSRSLLTVFAASDDDLDDIGDVGSAIRLTVPSGRFDISCMVAEREWVLSKYGIADSRPQQRYLYGFDAVGEFLGVGLWLEAQYSDMQYDDDYYEWVAGVDYTFENQLYLMAEYYHGSRGNSDPDEISLDDWMSYFNDEVLAVSSDQLYVYSEYPAGDVLKIGLAGLFSLNDQSSAFVPSVRYSADENILLSVLGQVYTGRDGAAFGSQLGSGILCRMRCYF